MKKTTILILGGTVALALALVLGINAQSKMSVNELFETNVEALADIEHWGTCGTQDKPCNAICPECYKMVWTDGDKGPGKLTHCSCSGTMTPITNPDDDTHLPSN